VKLHRGSILIRFRGAITSGFRRQRDEANPNISVENFPIEGVVGVQRVGRWRTVLRRSPHADLRISRPNARDTCGAPRVFENGFEGKGEIAGCDLMRLTWRQNSPCARLL